MEHTKLSKTILNPKLSWPFSPPKKPNKKKELKKLLASIPPAPF